MSSSSRVNCQLKRLDEDGEEAVIYEYRRSVGGGLGGVSGCESGMRSSRRIGPGLTKDNSWKRQGEQM